MSTRRPLSLSRRLFVQGTAATLAAAPVLRAGRALGANDRVRLGFIGVGKMGMGHLKWFVKQPDVEVRAIADVETSRRELGRQVVNDADAAAKRPAGNVSLYVDYQEMLAKDEVDAVVISTPDHWHAAPLLHAAAAKKDIYCEKPLTLTIEESELCVNSVRKHKVVLQTGSQQRSENEGRFRLAAALVRAGRIGRVTAVSGHFGPTAKPCDLPEEPMAEGLDWDRWLGQAPVRPWHHLLCQRGNPDGYPFLPGWRDYVEYSGGQVTDWGCHHLDIVQWALGMDGSGPTQALPPRGEWSKGGGGQLVYKKTPVGEDIVVTHRTFGNGIRFMGTAGEIWVSRGELIVTPGALWKDRLTDKELDFDGHYGDAKIDWTGSDKGTAPKITNEGHRREWLSALRSRKDPTCPVEVGASTAAVCHLLNLAYWNKKPIGWNAAQWAFVGPSKKEWKSRPQRKGYELPKV
jgi:predicted dehydrogenase